MRSRMLFATLMFAAFACGACGGGPRSTNADLASIPQPTPDPTLDAVVRDLPRSLAGVAAPSSTPTHAAQAAPTPKPRVATAVPSPRAPTATPVKPRR